MATIEVPEVFALAIVGRPIWRLTEEKHIVKLEITWQLPRTPAKRQNNHPTSKRNQRLADGVTGGMTMADKMAAPTLTTKKD